MAALVVGGFSKLIGAVISKYESGKRGVEQLDAFKFELSSLFTLCNYLDSKLNSTSKLTSIGEFTVSETRKRVAALCESAAALIEGAARNTTTKWRTWVNSEATRKLLEKAKESLEQAEKSLTSCMLVLGQETQEAKGELRVLIVGAARVLSEDPAELERAVEEAVAEAGEPPTREDMRRLRSLRGALAEMDRAEREARAREEAELEIYRRNVKDRDERFSTAFARGGKGPPAQAPTAQSQQQPQPQTQPQPQPQEPHQVPMRIAHPASHAEIKIDPASTQPSLLDGFDERLREVERESLARGKDLSPAMVPLDKMLMVSGGVAGGDDDLVAKGITDMLQWLTSQDFEGSVADPATVFQNCAGMLMTPLMRAPPDHELFETFCNRVAAAGGVAQTMRCMELFGPLDASVNASALLFLDTLTRHSVTRGKVVAFVGGAEAVLASLRRNPHKRMVVLPAVRIIWSLAMDRGSTHRVVEAGGIEALVFALSQFPDDDEMLQTACAALRRIARWEDERACSMIMTAGAVSAISGFLRLDGFEGAGDARPGRLRPLTVVQGLDLLSVLAQSGLKGALHIVDVLGGARALATPLRALESSRGATTESLAATVFSGVDLLRSIATSMTHDHRGQAKSAEALAIFCEGGIHLALLRVLEIEALAASVTASVAVAALNELVSSAGIQDLIREGALEILVRSATLQVGRTEPVLAMLFALRAMPLMLKIAENSEMALGLAPAPRAAAVSAALGVWLTSPAVRRSARASQQELRLSATTLHLSQSSHKKKKREASLRKASNVALFASGSRSLLSSPASTPPGSPRGSIAPTPAPVVSSLPPLVARMEPPPPLPVPASPSASSLALSPPPPAAAAAGELSATAAASTFGAGLVLASLWVLRGAHPLPGPEVLDSLIEAVSLVDFALLDDLGLVDPVILSKKIYVLAYALSKEADLESREIRTRHLELLRARGVFRTIMTMRSTYVHPSHDRQGFLGEGSFLDFASDDARQLALRRLDIFRARLYVLLYANPELYGSLLHDVVELDKGSSPTTGSPDLADVRDTEEIKYALSFFLIVTKTIGLATVETLEMEHAVGLELLSRTVRWAVAAMPVRILTGICCGGCCSSSPVLHGTPPRSGPLLRVCEMANLAIHTPGYPQGAMVIPWARGMLGALSYAILYDNGTIGVDDPRSPSSYLTRTIGSLLSRDPYDVRMVQAAAMCSNALIRQVQQGRLPAGAWFLEITADLITVIRLSPRRDAPGSPVTEYVLRSVASLLMVSHFALESELAPSERAVDEGIKEDLNRARELVAMIQKSVASGSPLPAAAMERSPDQIILDATPDPVQRMERVLVDYTQRTAFTPQALQMFRARMPFWGSTTMPWKPEPDDSRPPECAHCKKSLKSCLASCCGDGYTGRKCPVCQLWQCKNCLPRKGNKVYVPWALLPMAICTKCNQM